MRIDFDDVGYPQAALVALLLATLLGVGVAASTSTASFSVYNAKWDGASDLRELADAPNTTVELIQSTERYGGVTPSETVAIVLSPDDPYTDVERRRVRAFVRAGGTLVVAEDYDPGGNRLLEAVGARARIDGRPLRDERFAGPSPAFPVARNVSAHPLTAGVDRLVLNHGTSVSPNGATVLVRTSEYAYLDANGNGELDATESMHRYPVATVESVGDGRVIATGDPSLFINAMVERDGNRRFAENALTAESTVLLDYSHAAALPPLAALRLSLQNSWLLQMLVGVLGIGAIAAWGRRRTGGGVAGRVIAWLRPRRRGAGGFRDGKHPLDVDEDRLRAALTEKHPDWDDDRLRRVTQGIMARRDERRDDD
jgi:hypothetical protein